MYYDDEDDDPYPPRIGPAAMPSPRSRFAPYYSGHANTFENFLEEYEGLAYDCELTDPQRVDTLIRYVDLSLRELCRTLDGFRSRNWPLFRQSLVNIFGSTTPRHQVMRQKLHSYVQDSSRKRMYCEDDVLRYYRQFLCYSAPLVHAGHLTEEDRDAAFWYGFHPEDREVLRPRLLGKNPFQLPDVPFHFEDVFGCARAAFAYNDYFSSPWSQKKQFEPPSVRREQPVVEPIPRDSYSFREVTHVAATYTETTLETTPNEPFPSSHSTPDPQLPSSSSPSVLESQHGLVHSVTLDQPEPTFSTLSTTFLPSASEDQLEPFPAPTFPITTSTLRPSASSSTPSHASSLARSAADNDPIFTSTPPSSSVSSTFPSASPRSHTPSLVHSVTDNDLIPVPTFPIPASTFLPSATEHQSEPEPAPTLLPSIPILPIAPSHVQSAMNNFASTPSSASPTSSTYLPSVTEERPEPIPLIAPASTFASTPLTSSSPTFLPSPVISATDCQPATEPASTSTSESLVSKLNLPSRALSSPPDWLLVPSSTLSSLPLPEMSTLDSLPLILSPDQSSSSSGSLSHLSRPRELESSSPALAPSDVVTLSHPESSLSSLGETIPLPLAQHEASVTVPTPRHLTPPQRPPGLETFDSDSSPLEIPLAPANLASSPSTFVLLPIFSASSDLSSASPPPSLVLGDLELEFSPTASCAVGTIPLSSPQSFESVSSLHEPSPILPTPLKTSMTIPVPNPSLPQRPPRIKTLNSDSSPLEVTPASALPATPFISQSQQSLLVYKFSSTPTPGLPLTSPSLPLSRSGLVYFNFASALVSMSVLISTFLDISATTFALVSKLWSKQEVIGGSQNSLIDTSDLKTGSDFAQRFRLGKFTPRASRLVFDPGGSALVVKLTQRTRRHSPAQVEDTQQLHHHAQRHPSHSHSNRQCSRFRPRRWSVRVRASTRGFGDA